MADILDLHPAENETHFLYEHLRPNWVPGGMICHVPECMRTDKIPTLRAFLRHWNMVHVAQITLYICEHMDCMGEVVFKSKNDLHRHLMKKHKATTSEAHQLAAMYRTRVESNHKYVNPRENLPPRQLSPSVEMARQTDRLRRHQLVGVLGDLEGQGDNPINTVCRDEYVTFNEQGETTGKRYKRKRHVADPKEDNGLVQ